MYVSMTPKGETGKVLHCSQNDKDRKFEIQLYDEKSVIDGLIEQLYFPTYKGGTEQLLPINTSTPTTSNFRGTIEYPSGEVESEFVYRESPTNEDGRAKITEIKGNTIKFNQLAQNGNFADSSIWRYNSATASFSNNEATITPTARYGNIHQTISGLFQKHKYLISAYVKCTTNRILTFYASDNVNFTKTLNINVNNVYNYKSAIIDLTNETSISSSLNDFGIRDQNTSDFETFNVKNFMFHDLTAIFGSGNEPTTAEQFDTWLSTHIGKLDYYGFTLGDLISFKGTGLKTENASQTESNTLSLPTLTYFPTGMKSAGTVYDKLTGKQAIQRLGMVDMGTLTWSKWTYNNSFYAPLDNNNYLTTNALIANYNVANSGTQDSLADKTFCFAIAGGLLNIYIKDSTYDSSSASDFKTAMNGVYLIYELANPIITNLKSASLVCKGTELPIYNNEVSLIEDVTQEAGTFDCKVKLQDGDDVAYSEKLSLFVERKPL